MVIEAPRRQKLRDLVAGRRDRAVMSVMVAENVLLLNGLIGQLGMIVDIHKLSISILLPMYCVSTCGRCTIK